MINGKSYMVYIIFDHLFHRFFNYRHFEFDRQVSLINCFF